jgi:hypothetical protein
MVHVLIIHSWGRTRCNPRELLIDAFSTGEGAWRSQASACDHLVEVPAASFAAFVRATAEQLHRPASDRAF